MEYVNATLEEYEVIYPDGTSDYIAKYHFDCVQVNFQKKYD